MIEAKDSIQETYDQFRWEIPEYYNIGVDICDKWANKNPERLAIIDVDQDGRTQEFTFADLKRKSNQLANALEGLGLSCAGEIGDRVGVLLPQCLETAVSHVAIMKMGCISVPLFTLFGEEALLHRLRDSGAKIVITNAEGERKLSLIRDRLPELKEVISVEKACAGGMSFQDICANQDVTYSVKKTRADDPAILIYTSGTTGNPKGALHAHRVLLGHLPGVEVSHNFLPAPNDRFWTPADWAWIGGLLDVLMPALQHGISVVACRLPKFRAETAFELIKKHDIRNVFLPPTALKIMRQSPNASNYGLQLRSVASGGETLGKELVKWGEKVFGTTINEFYGQTECNMVVSCCSALEAPRLGSMGRSVPGHVVEIVDADSGSVLPPDTEGAIAVKSPDPVMFLGYWNNAKATAEKFVEGTSGKWLLTGDRGTKDSSGRIFFVGRDDDVISSAGYRIGPAEIEDCLLSHKAVQLAGVVGKPDDLRGSVVAAYIVLNKDFESSDQLATELAEHVKSHLAAYEYPRVVRFIQEMPMTTTGKIIRRELREMAEAEATTEKGAFCD